MSDERSQLEAWGQLERTDLAQQAYTGALHDHMHWENGQLVDDPFPEPAPQTTEQFLYGSRQKFFTTVQQQIEAQEEYPVDPIWQEDHMLEQLDSLLERRVITDQEHMEIFAGWITKRRPDTAVVKVPPKPRGYGRGYHNE